MGKEKKKEEKKTRGQFGQGINLKMESSFNAPGGREEGGSEDSSYRESLEVNKSQSNLLRGEGKMSAWGPFRKS